MSDMVKRRDNPTRREIWGASGSPGSVSCLPETRKTGPFESQGYSLTVPPPSRWGRQVGSGRRTRQSPGFALTFTMRTNLIGGFALALFLVSCASSAQLAVTPSQPEGPYYPVEMPTEIDSDLTRVGARSIVGVILLLEGTVTDSSGEVVSGAKIEIWQTDSEGIYLHPADPRFSDCDPNFQFFGVSTTDASGRYQFTTLLPGKYGSRPRHIHFKVKIEGRVVLTSQFYFANEPAPGLSSAGATSRLTSEVIDDASVLAATGDIVI